MSEIRNIDIYLNFGRFLNADILVKNYLSSAIKKNRFMIRY